ncbi:GNAT family N-acetyltransferase [Thiomicrorhabdus sp.]|uniref:GNAT family N-acetyltransferase n=1 Tax=Thiomicrorhabdus sp. TaxID=2039724 RepID=UPI0029C696A8|nr:GNAT family N-acetyltransferase [Thiomicrorhabdus sp.]
MFVIKPIDAARTYAFRQAILRPNQPIEACCYPGDLEPDTVHLGAFSGTELVGILSVYRVGQPAFELSECWQFRAMATAESVRGQGCGRKLLEQAQMHVRGQGGECLWANARSHAIGFYEKLDFAVYGEEFVIEGVGPHYVIGKQLA